MHEQPQLCCSLFQPPPPPHPPFLPVNLIPSVHFQNFVANFVQKKKRQQQKLKRQLLQGKPLQKSLRRVRFLWTLKRWRCSQRLSSSLPPRLPTSTAPHAGTSVTGAETGRLTGTGVLQAETGKHFICHQWCYCLLESSLLSASRYQRRSVVH